MRLSFAPFALAAVFANPALALAAPAAQALAIDIHADGARATQLPQYAAGVPIAIRVTVSGGGTVDGVTVSAAGPAETSVRMPLNRAADGSFGGTLSLQDPGSWRLHLTSHAGTVSPETAAVLLDVEPPTPSNAWQIGVAVGIVVFVVVGGTGFIALRRLAEGESGRPTARAA
jgi:hypothetical protein